MTALYGVVGDPIAHSLSPLIHKGWIRDHDLDADYIAMQVASDDLPSALTTLRSQNCRGLNITLPHKEDAFRLSDTKSDTATAIGAVNTLTLDRDGTCRGDNTDAPGFRDALEHAFKTLSDGKTPADKEGHAVVLGAGGASRAVAYVLGGLGQSTIFCNRTIESAQSLVDVFRANLLTGAEEPPSQVGGLEGLATHLEACSYVVNATSLGHSGQSIDWPEGRGRLVYDLSYGRAAEVFLAPARKAGWQTVDGLRMLVAQAAYSFEIWFGIRPNVEDGLKRARRTLEGVA